MVIDLGKPKVFKGLLSKRSKDLRMSRLQRGATFAKIFQKCDYVHWIPITLSSVFRRL